MKNNELKVKVLTASNLETANKNGKISENIQYYILLLKIKTSDSCNPYVRLQLHPKHNFTSAKGKTQIRRNAQKKDVHFEQAFDL